MQNQNHKSAKAAGPSLQCEIMDFLRVLKAEE